MPLSQSRSQSSFLSSLTCSSAHESATILTLDCGRSKNLECRRHHFLWTSDISLFGIWGVNSVNDQFARGRHPSTKLSSKLGPSYNWHKLRKPSCNMKYRCSLGGSLISSKIIRCHTTWVACLNPQFCFLKRYRKNWPHNFRLPRRCPHQAAAKTNSIILWFFFVYPGNRLDLNLARCSLSTLLPWPVIFWLAKRRLYALRKLDD